MNIVIVGNGIAAISAIKAIREEDLKSNILLFGDEDFYPYNRIRLSKGLFDKLEDDKILLQKKDWYDKNGVEINLNTRVLSIDTNNKLIYLEDWKPISYYKLLLASGAKNYTPPIPGIEKKGVYTLRTLKDAKTIIEGIKMAHNIIQIGGGIQGLETAWILNQHGKKVTIVEISERLMPKQLDEKSSQIVEKAIKSFGIDIKLGRNVEEVYGDEHAEGVILDTGEKISSDMIIYATGISPNIDYLENSKVMFNKGVIVNEKMETSATDVYAAGDVVEFYGNIFGLWNIAIEQGKVAGYNIVGKDAKYEHIVPVTTLNAFNLSLFSMGMVEENFADNSIVEESDEGNYKRIFIKDNKIVGGIIIGDTKKSPKIKSAIQKEIDLGNLNFENVSIDYIMDKLKI
ncbi:Assimilatory nitrate reductase electron transfer subunit [Caloramator mitchellensis]|uniref:Assimilatory nitrate reductase electron transfer subunit n=1 Tax=Caloramator mitchellensis TaxID=908809 RepID=A0A0R3JS78_CALMK|nr:FAD-dependent oxidoreductase [Caloramator mitchellensis]KRQ86337.1 Assimilatory nitrate reductase electron transfer subunit [Caloramator mitchellensis]